MFEEVWRAYEKNELSHSAAHHLMAIHELRQNLGYARVSDIAKHLSITKGSVSTTMKHLKERGYIQEDHNRFLELTEHGLQVVWETEATRFTVKKFLSDALGMDEDDAMSFTLRFHFGPNDYFSNEALEKTYRLIDDDDRQWFLENLQERKLIDDICGGQAERHERPYGACCPRAPGRSL